MDREAWHAAIHRVTKSWTRLSDWTGWLTTTTIIITGFFSASSLTDPVLNTFHTVYYLIFSRRLSVQFSSVAQSCPTLSDPMNCSTPGLPVHHQLLEFTQTHVHLVGDAIQPLSSSVVPFSSCPQSLPASESFPMSQLFSWGGQSAGVSDLAPFLPKNIVNVFKCPWLIHFKRLTLW